MKTTVDNISTNLIQIKEGGFIVRIYKDDLIFSQHWSRRDEMSAWTFIARIRNDLVRSGSNIDRCLANLQQVVRKD